MRPIFILLMLTFMGPLSDSPPPEKPRLVKRHFLVRVCEPKKPCIMKMKPFFRVAQNPDRWEPYEIQ